MYHCHLYSPCRHIWRLIMSPDTFFPLFNILNTVLQALLKGDIIHISSHFSCFPLHTLIFLHTPINIVPRLSFPQDLPSTESRVITFCHPESSLPIISKWKVSLSLHLTALLPQHFETVWASSNTDLPRKFPCISTFYFSLLKIIFYIHLYLISWH